MVFVLPHASSQPPFVSLKRRTTRDKRENKEKEGEGVGRVLRGIFQNKTITFSPRRCFSSARSGEEIKMSCQKFYYIVFSDMIDSRSLYYSMGSSPHPAEKVGTPRINRYGRRILWRWINISYRAMPQEIHFVVYLLEYKLNNSFVLRKHIID